MSEKALQIAEKRNKRQKRKGKIQPCECRVPKKNKEREEKLSKLSIGENNRMGKTSYVLKKIRDTRGTFHATMGLIKDRNDLDLTEAEDIKKRWQEYTEDLY